MTAYVVSQVRVEEGEPARRYREAAARSIAACGGHYLARGGQIEVLEGQWTTGLVIVAFPDMAAARSWYGSPLYAEALRFRDETLNRNLVIVEGVC